MNYNDLADSSLTLLCALRVSESLDNLAPVVAEAILAATAFHLGTAMRRAVDTGIVSEERIDTMIEELRGHAGPRRTVFRGSAWS